MWLTTAEIARRLGISQETVTNWTRAGVRTPHGVRVRLRAERHQGRLRIRQLWLDNFLKSRDGTDEAVVPGEVT